MSYNSIHAALAHSVQAEIVSLIGGRITGVVADSVRVRMAPNAGDFGNQTGTSTSPASPHAFPAILVVYGRQERMIGGTNARDDIGFPVTVVFVMRDADSANRVDLESNDDVWATWRQTISDVFRYQQFSVTNYTPQNPLTFWFCDIDPEPVVDWKRALTDVVVAGSLTLTFRTRKGRG